MLFIRINEGSQKIPWTTRLLMILGGLIVFSLLFFSLLHFCCGDGCNRSGTDCTVFAGKGVRKFQDHPTCNTVAREKMMMLSISD